MITASAEVLAALASGRFVQADLYKLTLINGQVYYMTNYALPIHPASGAIAHNLIIRRGPIKSAIGFQVDSMTVTINATTAHVLNGAPFLAVAHSGGLDGARLEYHRIIKAAHASAFCGENFWVLAADPAIVWPPSITWASSDTVLKFSGRVSGVEIEGGQMEMEIASDLELCNIQLPKNLYQARCIHTLYDTGCGKTKVAVAGTVGANPTKTVISTDLSETTGHFMNGLIVFTSGVNNGVERSINNYRNGVITLTAPLLSTPAEGDTFNAYAGCDGTTTTCLTRHDNMARFRGFPYIPIPETAI